MEAWANINPNLAGTLQTLQVPSRGEWFLPLVLTTWEPLFVVTALGTVQHQDAPLDTGQAPPRAVTCFRTWMMGKIPVETSGRRLGLGLGGATVLITCPMPILPQRPVLGDLGA